MKYFASIARGLGVTLALSVFSFSPQTVFAQDDAVEEVVVTGSRIGRGSDFEGPSPVLTVNRQDIENSGYLNLQQLLEKIPATGNGTFSTRGNNQDSTANGASPSAMAICAARNS